MRATCSHDGVKRASRTARVVLALAGVLGFGAAANAQLSDDPYFNLFSTGTTYTSSVGSTTGDGTEVWLCGTSACSGANSGVGDHLTGGGSASTGYAQFSIITTQPAGSGYIDPFLRFQHNEGSGNGNDTTEAAYNTDNDDLQRLGDGGIQFENQVKDTNAGGSKPPSGDFNHALLLSSLQIDDEGYMTFLLDINEPQNTCNENNANRCDLTSTLRLDELEFFISTTNMLSLYEPDHDAPGTDGGNFDSDPSGATTLKFWDMDFEKAVDYGRNTSGYGGLLLDNLNAGLGSAGSGDFDVQVRIPYTQQLAAFVQQYGASGDDLYVYLYNFAGESDDKGDCTGSNGSSQPADCGEAQAGFEEWAAVLGSNDDGGGPPTGVPVPPTALLLAAGALALARRRKH